MEKQLLSTKNSLSISGISTASITATDQMKKEPANTKIQKQRKFPKAKKKSRASVRYAYLPVRMQHEIKMILLGLKSKDQGSSTEGSYSNYYASFENFWISVC